MRERSDHKEKIALLDAWTVLEALSPRTFRQREDLVDGDPGCVAALSEAGVPWLRAERPRRDHKLYYHAVLLRDLIAQCVVDRAFAMAAFDEPERAFAPSGTTVPVGDKAYINLYRLDESLKGHEIVIASTNNRICSPA